MRSREEMLKEKFPKKDYLTSLVEDFARKSKASADAWQGPGLSTPAYKYSPADPTFNEEGDVLFELRPEQRPNSTKADVPDQRPNSTKANVPDQTGSGDIYLQLNGDAKA